MFFYLWTHELINQAVYFLAFTEPLLPNYETKCYCIKVSLIYYGIVKDEQWNYHLGKMYGCVCVCVCV